MSKNVKLPSISISKNLANEAFFLGKKLGLLEQENYQNVFSDSVILELEELASNYVVGMFHSISRYVSYGNYMGDSYINFLLNDVEKIKWIKQLVLGQRIVTLAKLANKTNNDIVSSSVEILVESIKKLLPDTNLSIVTQTHLVDQSKKIQVTLQTDKAVISQIVGYHEYYKLISEINKNTITNEGKIIVPFKKIMGEHFGVMNINLSAVSLENNHFIPFLFKKNYFAVNRVTITKEKREYIQQLISKKIDLDTIISWVKKDYTTDPDGFVPVQKEKEVNHTSLSPFILKIFKETKKAKLINDLDYFSDRFHLNMILKDVQNIKGKYGKLQKEFCDKNDSSYIDKAKEIFSFNIDSVADDIFDYGVHKRIEEDNSKYLLDGLYTYGRLQYLRFSFAFVGYGGENCYHVWDMFTMMASNNFEVINELARQIPGPFLKGHIVTRLLISALNIIAIDDETRFDEAKSILLNLKENKKSGKYDKNLGLIMTGILERNGKLVMDGIQYLLDRGIAAKISGSSPDLDSCGISLYSHGFYNLMRVIFRKHNIPVPPPPVHKGWDSDYDVYIDNPDHKPELILDFSQISPKLDEWLKTLPQSIDIFSI